jgi:hypothetical protein
MVGFTCKCSWQPTPQYGQVVPFRLISTNPSLNRIWMTSRGFKTGTFWPMSGDADEFGFECWFAIFEKQFDHFSQIGV